MNVYEMSCLLRVLLGFVREHNIGMAAIEDDMNE